MTDLALKEILTRHFSSLSLHSENQNFYLLCSLRIPTMLKLWWLFSPPHPTFRMLYDPPIINAAHRKVPPADLCKRAFRQEGFFV